MENTYGIEVKNKYDLFIDEDEDPYELLRQQEEAKKKKEESKKELEKGGKSGKNKQSKKPVLQPETKNKQPEHTPPKKEEKPVNQFRQGERGGRGGRPFQNKETREFREPRDRDNDQDRRPRRRDENVPPEFRDRPEGNSGGFIRSEGGRGGRGPRRGIRGGFRGGRGGDRGGFYDRNRDRDQDRDRDRDQERDRGDRGGFREERRGFGGFGGKREFERHSGSDKTSGVKALDKKDGGGARNWGSYKDDIERENKEGEETSDWNPITVDDTENQDPNESTESVEQSTSEAEAEKEMTLDEWKALQGKNRPKPEFNIRKAGEGVDKGQWKKGVEYRKKIEEVDNEDIEEEEDEEEDTEEERKKGLMKNIRITFYDSPRGRGGRGARRPRGVRGMSRGMGGGRGESKRGRGSDSAPRFDDEADFPSLVKTVA